MSRFYAPKENIKGGRILIEGEEAHHALDVMRLKGDDKVVVFDGTGAEYTGFIKEADKRRKRVIVEIVRTERPSPEKAPEITLAQAIPKKNKMNYIVEKATELGIKRIMPLVTARTIVRVDTEASGKKVAKWRRIATEAAKQCGRRDVPEVSEVLSYKETAGMLEAYDLVLFAYLAKETVPLKEAIGGFTSGKILVFIGPEGDFTPDEAALLKNTNARFVSLGRRVLRSETAGLFLLSVLNYEFSG